MHDYVRHSIASLTAQLLPAGSSTIKRELARQLLPYCAANLGHRDHFLLLNRNYKPIGYPVRRKDFVSHHDPAFSSWRVEIDPFKWHSLFDSVETTKFGEFSYFYGRTSPPPWKDAAAAAQYAQRMALLLDTQYVTRDGAKP